MKVTSEFSLVDSMWMTKKKHRKSQILRTCSTGREFVHAEGEPWRKRGIFISRHPGHVRGANWNSCFARRHLSWPFCGWSLDLISLGLSIRFSTWFLLVSRNVAVWWILSGSWRRISRRLRAERVDYSSAKFTVCFLRDWIVNNARCSESIHHDKTLQMNIDSGRCLFLTAIYNGHAALFTNDNKTISASEPYLVITISPFPNSARTRVSRKGECISLDGNAGVILASDIFPPSVWLYITILYITILAHVLYVSVRKKKHFNPQ